MPPGIMPLDKMPLIHRHFCHFVQFVYYEKCELVRGHFALPGCVEIWYAGTVELTIKAENDWLDGWPLRHMQLQLPLVCSYYVMCTVHF